MNLDLADPVLAKELNGLARRPQTYLARVIYVGMIGTLVYLFWSDVRASSVSDFANLGRRLFQSFFWLQFSWVAAVSVFGGADLVNREVRSGMLGLLALTPLDAHDVAWGKWKAAMAGSLSLVLCGVPVTAVCVYAGGAGLAELGWSTGLTVAAAAIGSAHAVLGASRSPTPAASLLRAAWGLTKGLLLFWIIGEILGPLFSAPFHPFLAAVAVSEARGVKPFYEHLWLATLPFCLCRAWVIVSRAELELKARGFGGPIDAPPDPRVGPMDPLTRFLYLGGLRLLEPPPWLLDAFPLVWKELVARAATRAVRLWQVPATFFAVLVIAVFALFNPEPAPGVVVTVHFLALLLALGTGSGLFTHERDGRRWDGLLVAPLGSGRIVAAKLVAPLLTLEAVALVSIVGMTVVGWGGLRRLELALPRALAASLLFLAFAYVLSAFASLHARNPRLAFLASSGLIFALLGVCSTSLGPPWLGGLNPLPVLTGDSPRDAPLLGVEYLSVYAAAILALFGAMVGSLRRAAA